jgi:hypothetical protein
MAALSYTEREAADTVGLAPGRSTLMPWRKRHTQSAEGCKRVTMQNVAGWLNVPVKVLR